MSGAIEPGDVSQGCARGLMVAIPDFALSAAFLVTWVAPSTFGQQAVRQSMNVMLYGFFVVHATGAVREGS